MTGLTIKAGAMLSILLLSAVVYPGNGDQRAGVAAAGIGPRCDAAALGKAMAIDTAALSRVKVKFPWEESTEGASLTAYLDAKVVKVLVLSFFGERGRVVSGYYLTPSGDFVLIQEELRYAAPIDVELPPRIVSRLPAVAYYCKGAAQNSMADSDVVSAKSTLDSALAVFRRSSQGP